jgi:hypothetical protein
MRLVIKVWLHLEDVISKFLHRYKLQNIKGAYWTLFFSQKNLWLHILLTKQIQAWLFFKNSSRKNASLKLLLSKAIICSMGLSKILSANICINIILIQSMAKNECKNN